MKLNKITAFILSAGILSSTVSFLPVSAGKTSDINNDGVFDISDIKDLSDYLVKKNSDLTSDCDINNDGICNVFDLILLKRELLYSSTNIIYVENSAQLRSALNNAQPGDEIVLKSGTYISESTGSKGANFWSFADGTKESPITIRSEDPEDPAVLYGQNIQNEIGRAHV